MENKEQNTEQVNPIKRWLHSTILEYLQPLSNDLSQIQQKLELLQFETDSFRDFIKNTDCCTQQVKETAKILEDKIAQFEQPLKKIQEDFDYTKKDFERRIFQVEENVRANNKKWDELGDYHRFDTELNKNTVQLQKYLADLEELRIYISKELSIQQIEMDAKTLEGYSQPASDIQSEYSIIDYFDFENHFRGKQEDIKHRQEIYLPYFNEKRNVIDLGCGRGEFLELLKENGIHGVGVDSYPQFVKYCRSKKLPAILGDALEVLKHTEKVDGIFAGQLVEHLSFQQLQELCMLSYKKLLPDCFVVMETPNPMSLSIYTHAFYMDPSHNKPVHPLTLQYMLQKCGFHEVQILFLPGSKLPVQIPQLKISDNPSVDEFNHAMELVSETLFGSQDYAVIAKK